MNSLITRYAWLVSLLSGYAVCWAQADDPVKVQVEFGVAQHRISPLFTGLNTSYFNDLEYVWGLGDVEQHLRKLGIRVLRWPGGEETSRFHWEHPAVDGYADIWNPALHDMDWQSVRVGSEFWDHHDLYVDLDRFIERCLRVGAEPLIGVNLSSGEMMNRRDDGIAAAVRLVQAIKERGYPVRYLYLCNEPWHRDRSNYFHFPGDLYAEVYLAYAQAIRAVAPELRLIASPVSGLNVSAAVHRFMEIAGDYVDYLNFHNYWEWGRSSWERWSTMAPMENTASWIPEGQSKTFTRHFQEIRAAMDNAGWTDARMMILEWNIAPMKPDYEGTRLEGYALAMAQAEYLLQLAAADIHMTAMWPMFWQARVPGFYDPEADRFGENRFVGPFSAFPPYAPTATYQMFRLLRDLPGSEWIETRSSVPSLITSAVRSSTGAVQLYVLNKSDEQRRVQLPADRITMAVVDSIDVNGPSVAHQVGEGRVDVPPWSLTLIRLVPEPLLPGD